jgi:5-oxoprolinase (ATP-hydrolysing)
MTPEEVAFGFIKIANEAMARPIRALTEARGYDTSNHRLATFGGAGGQHSCAIAETLGISQILIHRYSSVLSAYGMALADVVHEVQEPSSAVFSAETEIELRLRVEGLQNKATNELKKEGFDERGIRHELYLNMKYQGTDTALMIIKPENDWDFGKAFVTRHHQEFGFMLPDRDVLVDDIRVRGIGQSFETPERTVDQQLKDLTPHDVAMSKRHSIQNVSFEDGYKDTDVFVLSTLAVGDQIQGPAIIIDETQTIVMVPNSRHNQSQERSEYEQKNQCPNSGSHRPQYLFSPVHGHRRTNGTHSAKNKRFDQRKRTIRLQLCVIRLRGGSCC